MVELKYATRSVRQDQVDRCWTAAYSPRMSVKLRRLLTLLIVTAYVGATIFQARSSYAKAGMSHAAITHTAMAGMMQDQDNPGDRMPCKGMLPGCISDLGCIFLLSVPTLDLNLFTMTRWSSVIYDNASGAILSFFQLDLPLRAAA